MKNTMEDQDLDYEKITIYPYDYDQRTRKQLRKLLTKLGVRIAYERY